MGGDPPTNGDHPEAKPVFDLLSADLISAAKGLTEGHDFSGNALKGTPELYLGAVANPGVEDQDAELERLKAKLDAGAWFFQTQAVYEPESFARFAEKARAMGAKLLAGIIPLKSAKMAQFLNDKVPGITVPPALMDRIANATTSPRRLSTSQPTPSNSWKDWLMVSISWPSVGKITSRPSSKLQVFKRGELAIAEPRRAALVSHQRANATQQTATFAP